MYIHYVYNASLCVVYFISCITLCYCCTPTLNILIKLARDIISHFFSRVQYIHFTFEHTSPHTNETNYVCSIASLNWGYIHQKFHQNRPNPTFHLSLVLAATCTCCQVLATQGIQPSSTTLQLSTTHPMPRLHISDIHRSYLTFSCLTSSLLLLRSITHDNYTAVSL